MFVPCPAPHRSRVAGAATNHAVIVLLGLTEVARAVQPSKIEGKPFPVAEILLVTAVVVVCAVIVSSLAVWKSKIVEHVLATSFEKVGLVIGTHPWKFVTGAILFAVVCGGGVALQETELDVTALWVPTGSIGLEQRDQVERNWPSRVDFDTYLAVPDSGEIGANMLTPKYIQAIFRDYHKLMSIVVDGDEVVAANGNKFETEFGGQWTYEGLNGRRRNCFEVWPNFCSSSSVLNFFAHDSQIIANLDENAIKTRIAEWERAPMNSAVLGTWKTFEVDSVLAGISRDASGRIIKAETLRVHLPSRVTVKQVKVNDKQKEYVVDPINMLWGADAVCILGFEEEHPYKKGTSCSEPEGITYYGLFQRSFNDEFGAAMRNDIKNIAIAFYFIIIYLFLNLGKRDSVHSMIVMSFVSVACVGFSYVMSRGLGGYFGVKANPLNNNIPFLLLGLGVDDSFVLASEFVRHSLENPHVSIAERIAKTARSGGISVLVTSVTDALAFLIGSSTKLPALSGFCIYAGIGVLGCFLFVFFLFLPLLAINAQRASSNRFDCLCCCKAKEEHLLEKPQGCCSCLPCCGKLQPGNNFLKRALISFGNAATTTTPARISTIFVFLVVFIVGLAGLAQMKTEFKLEWFFPEDSYVNKFFEVNDKYYDRGTPFHIYLDGIDLYRKQSTMKDLSSYLAVQDFIIPDSVRDWYGDFSAYMENPLNNCQNANADQFYACMWTWYNTSPATIHRSNIIWTNYKCNSSNSQGCKPGEGVSHVRFPATLRSFENGLYRYDVLRTMREDMKSYFGDEKTAYPYSWDFLFWEENGIIMEELIRNLIISSGIIVCIICLLVPNARIAVLVSFVICASIVEVVGFAHWFGLTFNSVATVYFLICVGLAVDYSAHIGHTFKDSKGVSSKRAIYALGRIGPSVFQAVLSTLLAVIVIGFSKSYVFEVFFKILFLVTILAGVNGMWLLPALLSVLGGDAAEPDVVEPTYVKSVIEAWPDTNYGNKAEA